MTKLCTGCHIQKDISEFSKNRSQQDGYARQCKACKKTYQRNWYVAHRTEQIQRIKKQKKSLKKIVQQHILEVFKSGCVDCGETRAVTLEFDHVRGKKENHIGSMLAGGISLSTIQKEIAKCDIVCANCHRVRTAKRGNWWKHIEV